MYSVSLNTIVVRGFLEQSQCRLGCTMQWTPVGTALLVSDEGV